NCYASAILTYQIPEIREEIKYFVFGAEIGKMTFENGAVITSPISMSALMSEHLLQDMSDEEKGTVISAYTNLSQLWSTVFTDLNSAQLYATIAIRIGENLPIGSKSILALAYANWFKATLFANTVSKPNEDYSEAARAEAEKKITEIKDIGVNFNWESPYYASALLYAGQYFGLLGDNERSLDLLLESEAAFIRREEFTVAQYLLPKLKESYKELHPVKTALGGFDRWFEGEVSRRIN
ncbi:MAG: hypothetical protein LBK69_00360, partial [Syntrophomonadaceae bacterium]|nr:hypothetical protein [Syntrophomonadaceae bacterium]